MQLTNIILETNSIHAINMIQSCHISIYHLKPLRQKIIHFINLLGSTIRINHIYHEANTCVDVFILRGHQADLLIDKDLREVCSYVVGF
jgi:hypothetical protein